jgi:hypothetical protein
MTSVVDVVDPPTEFVASPCDIEARYFCAKEIPGIFVQNKLLEAVASHGSESQVYLIGPEI